MSLLSWAYQGLGNPSAVLALYDLVQSYCIDILFLCETLVQSHHIE